jgi:Ni2+-binding GTPase involved in maturation of urease and hydrogenase
MKLILAGGFLGAGKTTLLWESAKRLTQRGFTVGLITNDQAPDLVDTAILSRSGSNVREVAGSCFCCNFNGFNDAVKSLIDSGADCIIAEPVGSCTDLSATIVQPIKALFPTYSIAPLSVLVDPVRVREVLHDKQSLMHPDAAYIFRLQLQEADQIVINKSDSLTKQQADGVIAELKTEFPDTPVVAISALTGEGVEQWLDSVLEERPAGSRIAVVDYDRYANGEAVLGWLNAVVRLRWTASLEPDWEHFVETLFASLCNEFRENAFEIGHVKILLDAGEGRIAASLTALSDAVQIRKLGETHRLDALLTMNARVQTSPRDVEGAFRNAVGTASHALVAPTIKSLHCIKPGRPVPTYRYESVV